MQKATEYDWKDSNLALFGSDVDKGVKKASAETEPAWEGAGQGVGIQIWRIVKFKVQHWDKDQYGSFYDGDSYIILNTYKNPGEEDLEHDLHFWIGKNSTQDEYGTAAYKTVELDTLLDDKPVQHREVQGHESSLFKGYFKKFETMSGGADTGFRRVGPKEYKSRLMHFHGDRKCVKVDEVELSKQSLDSYDVYILDTGLKLYLWLGKLCNKDEKFKAIQYVQSIKGERGRADSETLDEQDLSPKHEFFERLPDTEVIKHAPEEDDSQMAVHRLSDESGRMEFTVVAEGELPRACLESADVFIVDNKQHCFVWVGKDASIDERRNAMTYAHKYLMKTKHPLIPVSIVAEGKETKEFNAAMQ